MVYSASSVVAELNPASTPALLRRPPTGLGRGVVRRADVFQAPRLSPAAESRLGLRVAGHGVVPATLVFFLDSKTHRWFRYQGVGTSAAVRIRQAGADPIFSRTSSRRSGSHQFASHHCGGRDGAGGAGYHRGIGRFGHGHRADTSRRVVFYVAGLERKFVRGARGGRLVASSDSSPPNLIAWRASSDSSIPSTK
jgi:hypothetical protein